MTKFIRINGLQCEREGEREREREIFNIFVYES
jgi:hypothetical protein